MKVFVGCYTTEIIAGIVGNGKGIYCFDFDSTLGQLKLLGVIPALNPSYLTLSKNKKHLYVIEEIDATENPKIKSFKINTEGNDSYLNLINEQPLLGSFACHLNISNSESEVIVACYMSGNTLVYPLDEDGSILSLSQNIQHRGNGPNLNRQEAAHAHMIYPFESNSIFVVDLGIDFVKAYTFNDTSKQFTKAPKLDIPITKGAGSRHMILHPNGNYAFVFSELTANIFSFKLVNKQFTLIEVTPSLPNDYKETPSGAAIRIHPNGKFIYVSNRGFDGISIFQFDLKSEKILLLGYEPSGGKTPREINIDPTGKWLLVANQDSNNIVIFSIDQKTALLKKHSINTEAKSPSCIQF